LPSNKYIRETDMLTFADKVIEHNRHLEFTGQLPEGIRMMNPFREHADALKISEIFYRKYYSDHDQRFIIWGINPGRFGAGFTGIPFTDTKRLKSELNISFEGRTTHEPSSVFIYEMINDFGGVDEFYKNFYINSVCPLGFTTINEGGRERNYNYYDSRELLASVSDYILDNIARQIALGINTEVCFCFGTGKNEKYLRALNVRHRFFGKIISLEHPRFIMQYQSANKQFYIDKYIAGFRSVMEVSDY
jgi:hypothetical protein